MYATNLLLRHRHLGAYDSVMLARRVPFVTVSCPPKYLCTLLKVLSTRTQSSAMH